MKPLKNSLIASILVLGLGCNSAEVKTVETDIAKVLQAADDALGVLASDPKAFAQAESDLSSLAAIAPQTGPIHQAIIDAQAALNAVQKNQGSVAAAQAALQTVINLLENQGNIPLGAVRHHSSTPPAKPNK